MRSKSEASSVCGCATAKQAAGSWRPCKSKRCANQEEVGVKNVACEAKAKQAAGSWSSNQKFVREEESVKNND
jgi:hypothetical protein